MSESVQPIRPESNNHIGIMTVIEYVVDKCETTSGRRTRARFGTVLFMSLACLLFAIAGCGRDDVKVYRVGKQQPENTKLPEGWTAVTPGQMRVAAFAVKGADGKQADVSVIPLPGTAGGVFANVNRWRGQAGLSPATEEEVKKMAEAVQISGQPAELYDISGTNTASGEAVRILASIQNRDGMAWFFKMTGDDRLVAQQKPAFIAFLKTFQAGTTGASSELPPSHPPIENTGLPAGHPEISAATPTTGAAAAEGKPNWAVPAGWKEVPGGQFLVAKFTLSGEGNSQAAVNVSMSSNDGGGLAANVNRWRGQLGLPPVNDEELSKLTTSLEITSGKATLVDMSGTDARTGQPSRMIGAILPRPGQTWFYKLMGDSKVVEAQKTAFMTFLQSVKD